MCEAQVNSLTGSVYDSMAAPAEASGAAAAAGATLRLVKGPGAGARAATLGTYP